MIPIREIAGMIHPARTPARRHILIFRFFCDESYDSKAKDPISYNVAGFFGDQKSWERLERRWDSKNKRVGAARFHAAHLNAKTYEFEGWTDSRKIRYSRDILRIIKQQEGRLHGLSCGIYADDYRRIISPEGQRKMGHPFLVCFKALMSMIGEQMDYAKFPSEDKFAVVLDQNETVINGVRLDEEAVRLFYRMKEHPEFTYRHRLATCNPGSSEDFIGLQPADFVAYEVFRLMHGRRYGTMKMRQALNTMLGSTKFFCEMFNDVALERARGAADSRDCEDNGLIFMPSHNFSEVISG